MISKMDFKVTAIYFIKEKNVLSIALDRTIPVELWPNILLFNGIAYESGYEFESGINAKHNGLWIRSKKPIIKIGDTVKIIHKDLWNKDYVKI